MEVAWGDRRYFHAADRSPQALAATLFLPGDSVLLLAGHPDPPRLEGTVAVQQRRVEAPTLHALLTALDWSARPGTTPPASASPPCHGCPARGAVLSPPTAPISGPATATGGPCSGCRRPDLPPRRQGW